MKSEVKKLSNSEIEIEIEVSTEELDKFFDQAVEKAGQNLEIQGFRKGKAPKNIVEEKIGKENILVEATDMAVKDNYRKVVLEHKLEPISEPKVDIVKLALGNPFIFKVKISILPEVDLPDYRSIAKKVEKKEVLVEDKEIDNALNWLQRSRSKLTLKNGPAEKGNFIDIEYSSPQIEKLGPDGIKKDAFIIGEGHFIPGFEDELIGMKSGEEKEFSSDIPSEHSFKQIAGKKIDFKIKVNSVQNVEKPELNDQFVKDLDNFENLEALKKNISEGLKAEKEQAESQRVRSEIVEKIAQASNFEIPDALIEREQKSLVENLKKEVSERIGVPFKDYLDKVKKTEQEILDSFKEEAQKRVKSFLILRAIGRKEKIEVSEEEARNQANDILKHYPAPEKAAKDIDFEQLKEYSREVIRNQKIFKLLEELIL